MESNHQRHRTSILLLLRAWFMHQFRYGWSHKSRMPLHIQCPSGQLIIKAEQISVPSETKG